MDVNLINNHFVCYPWKKYQANAIGRSAKTVREFLEKNYTDEAIAGDNEAIKLAIKALLEVRIQVLWYYYIWYYLFYFLSHFYHTFEKIKLLLIWQVNTKCSFTIIYIFIHGKETVQTCLALCDPKVIAPFLNHESTVVNHIMRSTRKSWRRISSHQICTVQHV